MGIKSDWANLKIKFHGLNSKAQTKANQEPATPINTRLYNRSGELFGQSKFLEDSETLSTHTSSNL